ncbi:MAG TPA: DNA topoisomerase IB, partial [Flavobacterium sp.]|nr:DNA topoisomerase IB [Flavobacterium sp.]
VKALFAFQEIGPFNTQMECKRNIVAVLDQVSKKLGNTRTVCKKYYVHPTVIASYEKGTINNYKIKPNIKNNKLNPEEEALVRLLKKETIAEVLG